MRQAEEDRFRQFARDNVLLLRRCAYLLCGDWHLAEDGRPH
jgi:DNA-directed RNA polymerase specialized sigma24 family protein